MSLNRKFTSEQCHELFEYTRHVLKENPACSEIMRWVRENGYTLENFFLAYTLMTRGKYDKNAYKDVMNEFNEKHKIELEESYSFHRLWSNKHDRLYNLTLQHIERDQHMEKKIW